MWDNIKEAVGLIAGGNVKRIDGDGFSAYAVGKIIRIDLKAEEALILLLSNNAE